MANKRQAMSAIKGVAEAAGLKDRVRPIGDREEDVLAIYGHGLADAHEGLARAHEELGKHIWHQQYPSAPESRSRSKEFHEARITPLEFHEHLDNVTDAHRRVRAYRDDIEGILRDS